MTISHYFDSNMYQFNLTVSLCFKIRRFQQNYIIWKLKLLFYPQESAEVWGVEVDGNTHECVSARTAGSKVAESLMRYIW